jgi:hypothetical protein
MLTLSITGMQRVTGDNVLTDTWVTKVHILSLHPVFLHLTPLPDTSFRVQDDVRTRPVSCPRSGIQRSECGCVGVKKLWNFTFTLWLPLPYIVHIHIVFLVHDLPPPFRMPALDTVEEISPALPESRKWCGNNLDFSTSYSVSHPP